MKETMKQRKERALKATQKLGGKVKKITIKDDGTVIVKSDIGRISAF